MTFRQRSTVTSRLATVLAAGLLPLALTACGVGKSPHTYEERPTVDAALASVGDLQLRNVSITAPKGSDELGVGEEAVLTMAIVNLGEANDRLVSASSAAASSVELVADGETVDRIEVPPLGTVGDDAFEVRLLGLTQAYRPGQHVEVTFQFTRGGRTTLVVPIEVYGEPAPRPTYDVFHIEEGGEQHSEGETKAEGESHS